MKKKTPNAQRPTPNALSLKGFSERMSRAFNEDRGMRLTPAELCALYLTLARMRELERFGKARDWESIRKFCPK